MARRSYTDKDQDGSVITRSDEIKKIITESLPGVTYIGRSLDLTAETSDDSWQIKRISNVGRIETVEWAEGSEAYNKVWDDRESYFPVASFSNLISTDFDGINDHVSVSDHADFNFERTQAFSLSFWFKTNSTTNMFAISKVDATASLRGYGAFFQSGQVSFIIQNTAATNRAYITTNVAYNDNAWHHTCLTYNGNSAVSGMKIYVDGAQIATTTVSNTLSATILNSANVIMGNRSSLDFPFLGRLDEMSIWGKELSVAEMTSIYNGGVPNDLSEHSAEASLVEWWRMGDGDVFNVIEGQIAGHNGTMTSMDSEDFVESVP